MVFWTLLAVACSGHAESPSAPLLTVEGAVLAMNDGTQARADTVVVQDANTVHASQVAAKTDSLEIKAPNTQWDMRKREATMTGGVVAVRGPVRMECAEMVVRFSAPQRVKDAVAMGGVRVVMGSRQATSDRAELTAEDGRIVMTGNPTLTDGANQMTGQRIVLWMDDERIECEACRMQIEAEAIAPAVGAGRSTP